MEYHGPQNNSLELTPPRQHKHRRKWPFIMVLVILIAIAGGFLVFFRDKQPKPAQNSSMSSAAANSVRLIAVGDNIPHDTINQAARTSAGYNYQPFFDLVKPYVNKGDVRFCNSETAIAGSELGISGYPTFNAPVEFAKDLNTIGCNLINLANNHVADKGSEGIARTRDNWERIQLLGINGANRSDDEQNKITYFEKNGIKFSFISFSEISNNANIPDYALNKFDTALVAKLLPVARKNSDFVIVSAHWGTEDSGEINNAQEIWAKTFADNGADLIIGTGPHVLQPVKKIPATHGETLVWYSLGNFLSTQLEINELIGGIASITITKQNEKTKISSIKFLPTYMHYEWSTTDKANQDLLKRKNLKLYPLDQAQGPLSVSLHNTTVDKQTSYVQSLLNKYMPVEISTSRNF